jgi:hypothetical protein
MYITTRSIAGDTLMTCGDCGHALSMNQICHTPLQSATDMLKHMAAHQATRAFAAVETTTQPKLPAVIPASALSPALGVPALVNRPDSPIAQPSPVPPECGLSGFSLDQLRLGEALLTM